MKRDDRRLRDIGWTLAALGAAAILAITVTPAGGDDLEPPLWCVTCAQFGSRAGVDLVLNVLLYVPLGLGLGLAGRSWRTTLAIALLMTVTIETLQWRIIPGRFAGISDIGANVMGAAAGMLVVRHWRAFVVPTAASARRLALMGAIAWLGVVGATAWALRPALPPAAYRLVWASGLAADAKLPGSILFAALNGVPLDTSPRPLRETDQAQLRAGSLRLDLTMVSWGTTRNATPILAVVRGERRQVLLLAQDGRALIFRQRLRARDVRFRHPAIEIPRVFPADHGGGSDQPSPDTIAISATAERHGIRLTVATRARRMSRRLAYSPIMGWGLVADDDSPLVPWFRWVTAAWMMAAFVPIGYWAARARRRTSVTVLVAVALASTLTAVPWWFGFPIGHWSEWLAGATALAGGWGAATTLARTERAPAGATTDSVVRTPHQSPGRLAGF